MNYPLLSEYQEAVMSAEDNFAELSHLRPVLDTNGEAVMTSGNFAVVFKMRDEQSGRHYAVKCFLKEQEGRAEAYRQISDELEYVSSSFLTTIKYLDRELFVDSKATDETEFPVVLMDWVEGVTLDKYIRSHLSDPYSLSLLSYQFSRLAMWLLPQPFAHGDLKPDNILVKDDGTLVLVDYDGMYVPAMKGQTPRETGSPDFRHPSRTEMPFGEHIDDFALASITLSLYLISLKPSLLQEYGAKDRLLFSDTDYRNLSDCRLLGEIARLSYDAQLQRLYAMFLIALSEGSLQRCENRLMLLSPPHRDFRQPRILLRTTLPVSAQPAQQRELVFTAHGVAFKMIRVDGGTFKMGATPEQGNDAHVWEKPVHEVTLSSYYIAETQVTQELWQAVMGTDINSQAQLGTWSKELRGVGKNHPMYYLSWHDSQEFVKKLNNLTGKTFRLPTEAEWEYAARGGNKSRGYKYAGSNTLDDVAWYDGNSGGITHPVKQKQANELGLYDMSGNVWEWCQDWCGDYSSSPQTNPAGPYDGDGRVLRSGGWGNGARGCRVSGRDGYIPGSRGSNFGFRLVLPVNNV